MTATTDTEAEFLATIAAAPDDTDARLVFADYLDEHADELPPVKCPACDAAWLEQIGRAQTYDRDSQHWVDCPTCKGAGTVRDTSRSERAELIRVQCELARDYPAVNYDSIKTGLTDGGKRRHPSFSFLAARESHLLPRVRARPGAEPDCPRCGGDSAKLRCHRCHVPVKDEYEHHSGEDHDGTWFCERYDHCPHCSGTGRCPCEWSRGFSALVRVPTLETVFERCTENDGVVLPGIDEQIQVYTGGWQPTPWGRALVARWPVTRVMPVDREPRAHDARIWWSRKGAAPHLEDSWTLPDFLFNALEGFTDEDWAQGVLVNRRYPHFEAAVDALALAAGNELRRMVYG